MAHLKLGADNVCVKNATEHESSCLKFIWTQNLKASSLKILESRLARICMLMLVDIYSIYTVERLKGIIKLCLGLPFLACMTAAYARGHHTAERCWIMTCWFIGFPPNSLPKVIETQGIHYATGIHYITRPWNSQCMFTYKTSRLWGISDHIWAYTSKLVL